MEFSSQLLVSLICMELLLTVVFKLNLCGGLILTVIVDFLLITVTSILNACGFLVSLILQSIRAELSFLSLIRQAVFNF